MNGSFELLNLKTNYAVVAWAAQPCACRTNKINSRKCHYQYRMYITVGN